MNAGRRDPDATRLGVVDEIFLRTHHGWGNPVVMQGLWRCAGRVDPALLESVGRAIAHGRLGRRVARSRVPLARPRFVADASAFPVESCSLPVSDLMRWADEQATFDVDPENGPGWRISVADLDDGETVVSLVCSHVIADARGLAAAIEDALTGVTPVEPRTPRTSDLRDALGLAGRVLSRTLVAVAGLVVHPERRRELRQPDAGAVPSARTCTRVIAEWDEKAWDAVAERDGGTPNSLFMSVVAELARAHPTESVVVSLPMDIRSTSDIDNSVAMVEVALSGNESGRRTRQLSRAAYECPPMSSPAGFPEELLQVVPDRVAHSMSGRAGERDALCSNIGQLPDGIRSLGPHTATGVATRAVHPRPVVTQSRIFAFLNKFDGRYTLALESTVDQSANELCARVSDVLTERGLTPEFW